MSFSVDRCLPQALVIGTTSPVITASKPYQFNGVKKDTDGALSPNVTSSGTVVGTATSTGAAATCTAVTGLFCQSPLPTDPSGVTYPGTYTFTYNPPTGYKFVSGGAYLDVSCNWSAAPEAGGCQLWQGRRAWPGPRACVCVVAQVDQRILAPMLLCRAPPPPKPPWTLAAARL